MEVPTRRHAASVSRSDPPLGEKFHRRATKNVKDVKIRETKTDYIACDLTATMTESRPTASWQQLQVRVYSTVNSRWTLLYS